MEKNIGLVEVVRTLKMKENKMMYLLFVLNNEGCPVNEINEKKIKHIPTEKFEEFINLDDIQDHNLFKLAREKKDNMGTPDPKGTSNIVNKHAMKNSIDDSEGSMFKSQDNLGKGMAKFDVHDINGLIEEAYDDPYKSLLDPDISFEPLVNGSPIPITNPMQLPSLNFDTLEPYVTTTEEDEDDYMEDGENGYEEGYNYVDNFYNKINQNENEQQEQPEEV